VVLGILFTANYIPRTYLPKNNIVLHKVAQRIALPALGRGGADFPASGACFVGRRFWKLSFATGVTRQGWQNNMTKQCT
jgi:hypothetical protein